MLRVIVHPTRLEVHIKQRAFEIWRQRITTDSRVLVLVLVLVLRVRSRLGMVAVQLLVLRG